MKVTVLSLPIELQLLILEYTLPPPLVPLAAVSTLSSTTSWSTFRARADALRSYCLVTKRWLEWARTELTRHVVLESDHQLRRFLLLPPRLGLRIATLRLGGVRAGRQLDGTAISELFRKLHAQGCDSEIREVWIVQVDHLDLRHLCHLDSESPPAHSEGQSFKLTLTQPKIEQTCARCCASLSPWQSTAPPPPTKTTRLSLPGPSLPPPPGSPTCTPSSSKKCTSRP